MKGNRPIDRNDEIERKDVKHEFSIKRYVMDWEYIPGMIWRKIKRIWRKLK